MSVRILGPRDARDPHAINVTTSSKTWGLHLSPMLLGPVKLYGDFTSKTVENGWQFSKVYAKHSQGFLKQPNAEYWKWAKRGWAAQWAERYPMGKGAIPEYSWWDGDRLDYIEARKRIYAPLYGGAVLNGDAWGLLKAEYSCNSNLTLFDYDGYDYLKLGMSLTDVLNDPTRKMGHAFVLAMMLEECL